MTEETGFENTEQSIDRFLVLLPQLLERFPDITGVESRQFANEVNTNDQAGVVTLAITGKIKQGKSTLINALIDRDLPTTGITEATATINRIKHVGNSNLDTFVVRWKDKSKEDTIHHLEEFWQYIGKEGKGKQQEIEHITMYADADFLKKVLLIDTPGEQGTQLQEIQIIPDALIRAIPFEVEANDEKKLKQYSDETRSFGSWPFNTIAVTQKWEQHWPSNTEHPFEKSPLDSAKERAQWQQTILKDSVALVIPTSALLWSFSKNASDELLEQAKNFVQSSSREDLDSLIKNERRYLNKEVTTSKKEDRNNLIQEVKKELGNHGDAAAWPILKMMIWACEANDIKDAKGLRKQLRCLSNMEVLKKNLEDMFFKRTRLLGRQTTLKKTLDIAKEADYKLNSHREELNECIQDADEAIQEIKQLSTTTHFSTLTTTDYLQKSRKNLINEKSRIEQVIRELQEVMKQAEHHFNILVEDTGWLTKMESNNDLKTLLDENHEIEKVKSLFGHYGAEAYRRLGCEKQTDKDVLVKTLFDELSHWKGRQFFSHLEDYTQLVDYAIKRLRALHQVITKMP